MNRHWFGRKVMNWKDFYQKYVIGLQGQLTKFTSSNEVYRGWLILCQLINGQAA
jgi:hypothetical protein|tara:strand:+ start:104225 stop:104386 length:162 start_codon:yes stop_codon:yes gene_type:complete